MYFPDRDVLRIFKTTFKDKNFDPQNIKFTEKIFTQISTKENLEHLMYIMNEDFLEISIRNISLEVLKKLILFKFSEFSVHSLNYIRQNIFEFEKDNESPIRKEIPNLFIVLIKSGILSIWPNLLETILTKINLPNLSTKIKETYLEIISLSISDTSAYDQENSTKLFEQTLNVLKEKSRIFNRILPETEEKDENEILKIFEIFQKLLDKKSEEVKSHFNQIIEILLYFKNTEILNIRANLGELLLNLFQFNFVISSKYQKEIFFFFFNNYRVENYKMNLSSSEFFLFLLEKKEEFFSKKLNNNLLLCQDVSLIEFKNENKITNDHNYESEMINIYELFEKYLKEMLPYILHYMKISHSQMQMENLSKINKANPSSNELSANDSTTIASKKVSITKKILENLDLDEDIDYLEYFVYNSYWTLRKCSSKLIDKIASNHSLLTYSNLRPFLEVDLQSSDWIKKERSILALGAIGVGCYEHLKPHLNSLLNIIIQELQSKNKLIRTISCWTLSRFTNFIVKDNISINSEILFKKYFNEIKRRLIDSDELVQESAGTAFSIFLSSDINKLRPLIPDILKVTSIIITKISTNYMNILHDITLLLVRSEEEIISKDPLIEDFINCIILKLEEKIEAKEFKGISCILEIITIIVQSNGYNINEFIPYLVDLSLVIMQNLITKNNEDHELRSDVITKSLNLISVLYTNFPSIMLEYTNKKILRETLLKILEINNNYIRHFVIAVIGEITQVDSSIFIFSIKTIMGILIESLEYYEVKDKDDYHKICVCNNTCWTIGLLAITYSKTMIDYINDIIKKIIKILLCSNIKKSLSQNIAICIGRCSLIAPQIVSVYLDEFLKHSCVFLRNLKNSQEKIEAFKGFCKAIIQNPNGVINHFPFFCDAVSFYEDAPSELESLFKNLIYSYKISLKDKWSDYFDNFPEKLKEKMNERYEL